MINPIVPSNKQLLNWFDRIIAANNADEAKSALIKISQWGADAELKACVEWLEQQSLCGHRDLISQLRSARRPKSLKQHAIAELDDAVMRGDCITVSDALPIIRQALESLPND